MKTRSILTLALLAGCNYDYSLIEPDPEIPKETSYDAEPGTVADEDVQQGVAGDTGEEPATDDVDEPTPADDDAQAPPEGDPEPAPDTDADEPAAEEPPAEEEPPPTPPDPCASGDSDGDGWKSLECGGEDCNDDDPAIHPLAGDSWNDGLDRDCDGLDCNAGWFGDGYFAACPTDVGQSQDSATDYCIGGGHDGLASMRTPEEAAFVVALRPISVGMGSGTYRVGLTTDSRDGTWVWDDGTPLTWNGWAPGQPSYSHMGVDEFCGTIYPSDMPGYLGPNKWNDMKCGVHGDEYKSFVCGTRG